MAAIKSLPTDFHAPIIRGAKRAEERSIALNTA
jgi:hypothetical protein